jgi:hypothetical protein
MMTPLKEKLHVLIDKTDDPVILENIYRLLNDRVANESTDILDELSEKDMKLLEEAQAEYRRGETVPHAEVMEFLKKWREK